MPKLPPTIHPSVQPAIDERLRDATAANNWSSIGEEDRRTIAGYYRMRQRRTWPALFGGLLLLLASVVLMAAFKDGAWVGLGGAFAALLAGVFALSKVSDISLTFAELAVLSPALLLTSIQRAYLDAKLALGEVGLPADIQAELDLQLDRLVDEEARLRAMQDRGAARVVRPDELEAERERLRTLLAATVDPPAREALEASLRTCERRLESARTLSLTVQRIDAQLEMIGQAIGDVRDGLLRLRLAPGATASALELDPTRETLAHVQTHAAAIEAAVAEVQAIGRGS